MQVGRKKKDTGDYPEGARVVDRLLEAYRVKTLVQLSERLGQKQSTVKNWRYRGAVPRQMLLKAAKDTERSLHWLFTGEEPVLLARESRNFERFAPSAHRVEAPAPPPYIVRTDAAHARGEAVPKPPSSTTNAAEKQGKHLGEMQVIPRFELHISAGRGGALQKQQASVAADMVGVLAMDREFMRQNLGHDGEGFASLRVSGDFMAPTLQEGDVIIFDTLIDRVNVTGVYVLRTGDDLEVVRIHRKRDGTLVLKGDNPKYEPEVLSAATARELKVMGRMMWPKAR
jgi:SOS-response transcriptional repressor LexA